MWRLILAEERGTAMVEFVLIFPVQFIFILGIMQLSLIYVGAIVVNQAASAAARAALVADLTPETPQAAAERAARLVCSAVAGTGGVGGGGGAGEEIPGWGRLERWNASWWKTRVTGQFEDPHRVAVLVEHDFELVIPVINRLFAAYWPEGWFGGGGRDRANQPTQRYGYVPHITLRETGYAYRPWALDRSGGRP